MRLYIYGVMVLFVLMLCSACEKVKDIEVPLSESKDVTAYEMEGYTKQTIQDLTIRSEFEYDDLVLLPAFAVKFNRQKQRYSIQERDVDKRGSLPLENRIIGIDPGHQLNGDYSEEPIGPGASVTKPRVSSGTAGIESGTPEHIINLQIGLILKEMLEKQGATVVMTRTTAEVNISNRERAEKMNDVPVDVHLRLHCNGSSSPDSQGIMVLVPHGEFTNEQLEANSYTLGTAILDSLVTETGAVNEGIVFRGDISGFNWSTVPVVLIEFGYMTNPEEDMKLNDQKYQQLCSEAVSVALVDYFNP